MQCPAVSIQIIGDFQDRISEHQLIRTAELALSHELRCYAPSLSVVIADDQIVRDLNKRHRGLDENTDVLAFSFTHHGEYYGEGESPFRHNQVDFVLPPAESLSLGEVIISYPQAQRQAAVSDHTVEKELLVLLIHGVLHLLGYDHQVRKEKLAMKRTESKILDRVQLNV